jgi:hypothetical protein
MDNRTKEERNQQIKLGKPNKNKVKVFAELLNRLYGGTFQKIDPSK